MAGKRVLVAYGSRNGGTAGIAETIGQALRARGFDVTVHAARTVRDVGSFDAVVLGGALYMSRWHADAVRFARRHARALRDRPVWLFSSGPVDASAEEHDIPPVPGAERAATLVAARQHVTFGGRLDEHTRGWIAGRMVASGRGGDFRNVEHIRRWADDIGTELSRATVEDVPST